MPGPGIPGPVGVEGPGGVLKAGVSTGGPPGPGPGPGPKCPFQPGTGSSNVLANVVAILGPSDCTTIHNIVNKIFHCVSLFS